MADLQFNHVTIGAGDKARLRHVSTQLSAGEFVALVGPNGAGKTTLLQCALGITAVTAGQVTLDGKELSRLSPLERARNISYLPQIRPLAWPVLVRDTVALGRFAYGGSPARLSPADKEAVAYAMQGCGIEHLADRRTDQLSGGELARVHCARAFAARTPLLLADEPVASLDPSHQLKILSLLRSYVDSGGGALVVMHDLNLAARYADRMIWMKAGKIFADGSVTETVTAGRIEEIFDVGADVNLDKEKPVISINSLA